VQKEQDNGQDLEPLNSCSGALECVADEDNLAGVGRGQRKGIRSMKTVKWGRYQCECVRNGQKYEFVGPGKNFIDLRGTGTYHSPYMQTVDPFTVYPNSRFDRWRLETFIEAFENNYQSIPNDLKEPN